MKGLIGKKLGMTQVFDEGGAAHPVTLIEAGPCFVTQIRRADRDAVGGSAGAARAKRAGLSRRLKLSLATSP